MFLERLLKHKWVLLCQELLTDASGVLVHIWVRIHKAGIKKNISTFIFRVFLPTRMCSTCMRDTQEVKRVQGPQEPE